MIVPNLMVTDMARAIAFYRDVLGLELAMSVDAERNFADGAEVPGAVFAMLRWGEAELMLQTAASLAEELPVFAPDQTPAPAGTIYLRGMHPDTVAGRVDEAQVVRGPFRQWYGMVELYIRDPDGHILCLGTSEGEAPG